MVENEHKSVDFPTFQKIGRAFFNPIKQIKKFGELGAQIFREYLSVSNSLISGVFVVSGLISGDGTGSSNLW